MDQQPGSLHVTQEAHAQAMSLVSPFDEPGDVGHHEGSVIAQIHHPQIRGESREGVVGDLGPGCRNPRDQS